jgi:thiol:disulfide interchange protein DsbC
MKFFVKLTLLTWFISQAACAAENEGGAKKSEKSVATISAASLDAIKIKAQAVFRGVNPQYKVASINESGIDGFYLVQIEQGPAVYVNADVSHFFTGEAFTVEAGELVNLTQRVMDKERLAVMSTLQESDMLVFDVAPPAKRKAQLTIFTDVDCYYCQKLHQEVPALNKMGIAVRYMAFPRAGVGSDSYKKIVSAWCADNPQTAMTLLKSKQSIAEKNCNNPVVAQYKLGQAIGVTGTPAIILDDGSLIPGYRPADKLAEALGIKPEA